MRCAKILLQDGLVDGVVPTGSSVGFYFLYPAITPSPTQLEVDMDESNDFVVIGKPHSSLSSQRCKGAVGPGAELCLTEGRGPAHA